MEQPNKIIKSFYAVGSWVYSEKEGDIEVFYIKGETTNGFWLRKGKSEYNGKYIEQMNHY
jgi:hypothetical protein